MKKIIGLILSIVLLVSCAFTVSAFDDVDPADKALSTATDLLTYMNITKGVSDTEFGTDNVVTREQFALFVYRLVKGGKDAPADASNTTPFVDLGDPTYNYAISWAYSQGIVKGTSDTTFNPKGSITLEEAYTMLVRALGYEKEENLNYPYGYIEVAESKNVNLNDNIDVNYKDTLTRGNMAILLYNTFFAETGVAEEKAGFKWIGNETSGNWVATTVKEYPTFCEKYFGVIEAEYQAIATPKFVFGADESTENLGYDAIEFKYVGEEELDVPVQFYADFADLNLPGVADDYIMSHFTMYVVVKDDVIDEILFIEPLMNKITVDKMTLGEVKAEEEEDYYGDNIENAPLLSGKVSFNSKAAYFYDAPYSYAKPKYTTGSDEDAKYAARNAKNLKFIDVTLDDEVYTFEVIDEDIDAYTLIEDLALVYTNGIYEATLYDVNGDDIFDYIFYMPYEAYFVSTDDDYAFEEDGIDDGIAYVYDAIIDGKVKDEDYVVGYFNPALNYIKVLDVIKPIKGEISSYKNSKGTVVINGKTYDAISAYTLFANFAIDGINLYEENEFDIDTAILNNDEFYVYNNIILVNGDAKDTVEFDGELIIPTNIKAPIYDRKTDTYEVYAWVDGKLRWVNVETEDIYPAIISGESVSSKYANQLCSYVIRNDKYVITALAAAEDEDGEYIGMEKDTTLLDTDDAVQVIMTGKNIKMSKYMGNRYEIEGLDNKVVITDKTRIIIRTYDSEKDKYIYTEYDKSDFVDDVDTTFDTVSYIVSNNADRKDRDDLVILYATVKGDFNFVSKENKDGYRIIYDVRIDADDEGDYRYFYEVLNPYTGKIEEVMSAEKSTKISGLKLDKALTKYSIVKLVDDMVEDSIGNMEDHYNWLVEFDAKEDLMALVACTEGLNCEDCIDNETETYYYVDDDTKVTVLTDNGFKFADINDDDLLVYNTVINEKGKTEKVYAPYVKLYVEAEDKKDYDYPVAKFIVIVAVKDSDFTPCNH